MPGPTDDYFAYKRWFEANHDALRLPADCVEPEPPTFTYSNQYTWGMEWHLVFRNPETYVRIAEHFAKRSRLSMSRRIHFAYHYGPIVKSDDHGIPVREPADPVFVRIDNVSRPAHLHREGHPTEHIAQANVEGVVLEDVDLFDFVRAALMHRQEGRPIERELGYRIA